MQILISRLRPLDYESAAASQVLTTMTSVYINAASALDDQLALGLAAEVLKERLADAGTGAWRLQAAYNLANAIDSALQSRGRAAWNDAPMGERSRIWCDMRVQARAELCGVRVNFERSSKSSSPDQRTRSLTNLGNALDSSGRWLEAYEAYVAALDADPSNGNAAGNAAYTLQRAIAMSLGPAGHIAAVYGRFRTIAQQNRTRTVALAGTETADRWDRLPEITTQGHFAHNATEDPYVQWVATHCLALTPVVEGLGSDGARFDDITVSSVRTSAEFQQVPSVFAAANVVKGDFLAARRTVFNGHRMLDDLAPGKSLHDHETGTYTDTLDSAIYGEPVATVILGTRSALDLLDKLAVALNDYLEIGLDPSKVNFRNFWFEPVTKKTSTPPLRQGLRLADGDGFRVLALAELATDFSRTGLYAAAQRLRHLSTHRLVRASAMEEIVPTDSALSTVSVADLRSGSLQVLRVVRAAILYVHQLITEHEKVTAATENISVAPQILRSLR
jgi:tetratricopeptide (TPR) repeat protein